MHSVVSFKGYPYLEPMTALLVVAEHRKEGRKSISVHFKGLSPRKKRQPTVRSGRSIFQRPVYRTTPRIIDDLFFYLICRMRRECPGVYCTAEGVEVGTREPLLGARYSVA